LAILSIFIQKEAKKKKLPRKTGKPTKNTGNGREMARKK
jgi:hypothetical protein